jgi:hypothetical protein
VCREKQREEEPHEVVGDLWADEFCAGLEHANDRVHEPLVVRRVPEKKYQKGKRKKKGRIFS